MSLLCDVFDLVLTFFDIFFRLLLHEQFGPITFLLLHKTRGRYDSHKPCLPLFYYLHLDLLPAFRFKRITLKRDALEGDCRFSVLSFVYQNPF